MAPFNLKSGKSKIGAEYVIAACFEEKLKELKDHFLKGVMIGFAHEVVGSKFVMNFHGLLADLSLSKANDMYVFNLAGADPVVIAFKGNSNNLGDYWTLRKDGIAYVFTRKTFSGKVVETWKVTANA